jgi:carbon-monoxide dehydrogenase small subunit
MTSSVTATINGRTVTVQSAARTTLLEFLRDTMRLTGAKEGCGNGNCGTCTVLVDGQPVNACLVLAAEVDRSTIVTIEGLAEGGALHPIQEAFLAAGATQCGFCTPGMILTAKALLDANPSPNEDEIRRAIAGNLCRCTGYGKIVEAIAQAAEMLRAR